VKDVPDPENEGKFLDVDTLMTVPHIIKVLEEESFRAVRLSAGDNIGAAISENGSLRVWGTFKVSTFS
jgi:regulator of chromosome condensation